MKEFCSLCRRLKSWTKLSSCNTDKPYHGNHHDIRWKKITCSVTWSCVFTNILTESHFNDVSNILHVGQGKEKNYVKTNEEKQTWMQTFLQEISSSDYSGPIIFLNNVDISFSDSIILEFCVFKLCQFKFYSTAFYNTHCSGILLFH